MFVQYLFCFSCVWLLSTAESQISAPLQAERAAVISLESLIVSSCLFGADGAEQVISRGLLEPFFLNKDTCGVSEKEGEGGRRGI